MDKKRRNRIMVWENKALSKHPKARGPLELVKDEGDYGLFEIDEDYVIHAGSSRGEYFNQRHAETLVKRRLPDSWWKFSREFKTHIIFFGTIWKDSVTGQHYAPAIEAAAKRGFFKLFFTEIKSARGPEKGILNVDLLHRVSAS